MTLSMNIRYALPGDSSSIAAIYNEGIRARIATFETAERHPGDLTSWFVQPTRGPAHPFLVATDESNTVLGWVRSSSYRARECYEGIGDFSVYVAESSRGRRVGDSLMREFIPECARVGLWKLVSRIFPENLPSRALCARHGFREVGMYEKHARLDGLWKDVVIVERLLLDNH